MTDSDKPAPLFRGRATPTPAPIDPDAPILIQCIGSGHLRLVAAEFLRMADALDAGSLQYRSGAIMIKPNAGGLSVTADLLFESNDAE